ncbi:MAG: hypothetical protein RBT63_05015 [Bdellovibrionales bacterium]|nr:hypothetical protein [Bdellovibrionales bacterium]
MSEEELFSDFGEKIRIAEQQKVKQYTQIAMTDPLQISTLLLGKFRDESKGMTPHPSHAACKNVPCLYDAYYRKTDSIEGKYAYYWWLRMNSPLMSATFFGEKNDPDKKVHTQFSRAELRNFALLASSLVSAPLTLLVRPDLRS